MNIGPGLRKRAMLLGRMTKRVLRFGGEDGGALVEFAVTLPLFMTVLTGTASFSMAFFNLQQIGNAASSSAQRLGAVARTVSDPCNEVVTQVTASLPGFDPTKITYTAVITNAAGTATTYGPTTGSTFSCTAAGSGGSASTEAGSGEPDTVTLSYQYSWLPVLAFSPSSALASSETVMAD
jgi:Flp pilus assembly protein TadG